MRDAIRVGDRRRRSQAEAASLVRDFEQSGLSRKAFCSAHGVALHTLDYYRARHRTRPHFARAGFGWGPACPLSGLELLDFIVQSGDVVADGIIDRLLDEPFQRTPCLFEATPNDSSRTPGKSI